MVISKANPQTTTSFMPMERDLSLICKLGSSVEVSFIWSLPVPKLLCIAKLMRKKKEAYASLGVSPRIELDAGFSLVPFAASLTTCSSVDKYSR